MKPSCTCREDFERMGRERFVAQYGDLVDGEIESKMDSHVYLFAEYKEGGDLYRPALTVTVRAKLFNKRSPGSRMRKMEINAIASYCPFCGREFAPIGGGKDA